MSNEKFGTPKTLRVLAVDDEAPSLADLVFELRSIDGIAHVEEANDASQALRALRSGDFDAVFLDVRMPGLSGIELARVLQQFKVSPLVVFVTAHDDHAVEAFEINAADYLLKPVRRERLEQALEKIRAALSQRDRNSVTASLGNDHAAMGADAAVTGSAVQSPSGSTVAGSTVAGSTVAGSDGATKRSESEMISIESGGRIRLIDRRDILYVASSGDYVRLFMRDSSVLMRTAMSALEERWADAGFIRIHRSYLVSLAHVEQVRVEPGGTYVVHVADRALPVSRRLAGTLRAKLVEYAEKRSRS